MNFNGSLKSSHFNSYSGL